MSISVHSAGAADSPGGLFWAGVAGLVALYLAVSCHRLADVPLLDPDEPRYAAAARTMAAGGPWLVPQFNGEPRINKPPLLYWLVALSMKLGGASEITARAPSIALGLLMLLTTVWLCRRVFSAGTALLAGLVLATTPLFMAMSRTCTTDMTMSALVTVMLALVLLADLRKLAARPALALATVALGLAILTKATPALVVILVLVIDRALAVPRTLRPAASRWIPWLLAAALCCSLLSLACENRALELGKQNSAASAAQSAPLSANPDDGDGAAVERYRVLETSLRHAGLVAAVAAVLAMAQTARRSAGGLAGLPWGWIGAATLLGLWWYVALFLSLKPGQFSELLRTEIGGRLAGEMHRQGMHYFLPVLLTLAFPWSAALPGAIGSAWPRRNAGEPEDRRSRATRFLVAWVAGVVLFFSIPNSKLNYYILPAMPAAAILTAHFLIRLRSGEQAVAFWRKITVALAATSVAAGALALVAMMVKPDLLGQRYRDVLAELAAPAMVLLPALFALLALGWFWLLRRRIALGASLLLVFVVAALYFGSPVAADGLERRSMRRVCRAIESEMAGVERFSSLGAPYESLVYYLNRTVIEGRRRAVDKGERFVDVVVEELRRPEKVMLFLDSRYSARTFGTTFRQFEAMPDEDLIPKLPPEARMIGRGPGILVLRNRQ